MNVLLQMSSITMLFLWKLLMSLGVPSRPNWRMGKCFSMLGGQQRPHQLSKWKEGSEANWTFTINETEVNCQSFLRKRKVEAQHYGLTFLLHCISQRMSHHICMHLLCMYLSLWIFMGISQCLPNDLTTIHFQRSSNHRDTEGLRQIPEKWNRLEYLEDCGYQRVKREQKCTNCKLSGHNKRTCPNNQ